MTQLFLFVGVVMSLFVGVQYSELSSNKEEFKLIVEIDNIKNTEGKIIQIAVSKKGDFLKDSEPYRYAMIETKSSKINETFKLPAGEYAVSIYHDLNGNGKMDKNFFGAPSEPYAFSKNYKPTFRAPKFDEVKIDLSSDRKTNISLIHP